MSDACHDGFIPRSSDAVAVGIVGHSSMVCQPVAADTVTGAAGIGLGVFDSQYDT